MVALSMRRAAIALSLSVAVEGHLTLQQPVPYSQDTLVKSPLKPDGSNYPCQLRENAFDVVQENMVKVGKTNEMTWDGSASHGGGTCQLSVSLDRAPTASSTFKVIASWIGGCPSANSSGGTHPFEWSVPPEVPNGKATLAWNWVSKLSGGPENYMNCAPITVSGGASNTDGFDKLVDLFKVNLPATECGSQSSSDLEIPNPGKYVTTFGSTALATPTGTGCAAMGQASRQEHRMLALGLQQEWMNRARPRQALLPCRQMYIRTPKAVYLGAKCRFLFPRRLPSTPEAMSRQQSVSHQPRLLAVRVSLSQHPATGHHRQQAQHQRGLAPMAQARPARRTEQSSATDQLNLVFAITEI